MADPTLVLLILLGAQPADRPRAGIVSTAITEALASDARVLLEERTAELPDSEAAASVERIHANALAEVAWADALHTRARLHVYVASERVWYDRTLSFEPGDTADDRERAVGFLVGAIIRTSQPGPGAPPLPPPPPAQPARVAAPPDERAAPLTPAAPRFAADLSALATAGIAGDAGGLGPSVRGHVFVAPSLSLHAGASLGFGSIDAASASMTTTRLAAGGRWRFLTVLRDLSFELGVEALVLHHAVRRADPGADRDRWLSGGHTDLGVGWRLGRAVEPFATGGLDAAFGTTPIAVAGQTVAQIPPFRAVAEAGLRVYF